MPLEHKTIGSRGGVSAVVTNIMDALGAGKSINFSSLMSFVGITGQAPSRSSLLSAYSRMPWLRAAFGKVADGTAAAPWYMENVVDNSGKNVRVPALQHGSKQWREKTKKITLGTYETRKTLDHPFLRLMANPNEFMTGSDLIRLTQLHRDLVGEAIWWLQPGPDALAGKIKAIYPIPPHWVSERPNRDGRDYFTVTCGGFPKRINLSQIVWFRDPDPENPYDKTCGSAGPISDELEADEYAAKHVKAWFQNQARPDLLISGTGLTAEENERGEEKWLQKLQGFLKVGKPHFIGSEVSVTELGRSFVDMQLVQLRKFNRDVVLQSLGLPPEIMGIIESSNRATIDTASYVFAKWVLTPRLDGIRETLQTQVIPLYDDRFIIDYLSPVEEDREFRLKVMQSSPYSWSIDEWRSVVGDEEMPNGQGKVIVIPNASSLAETDKITEWESPYTQEKLNSGGD